MTVFIKRIIIVRRACYVTRESVCVWQRPLLVRAIDRDEGAVQ